MRGLSWTTIALIAGLVLLVLAAAYLVSRGNADQDKLTNSQISAIGAPSAEKACARTSTYELLKRDLFRRAAQLRGSDQAEYDRLSGVAVVRMENPVMESQDSATGAVNCSGSLSLDLPPGVAVVGGRRTLMSDVDYTVQPAADGSGNTVLLRNADAIITPLATLARTAPAAAPPTDTAAEVNDAAGEPATSQADQPPPAAEQPAPSPSYAARPSYDCSRARTKREIAVCSDSGRAALDVTMAAQYRRASSSASAEERSLLQATRDRFIAYRDRCTNRQCIADAYVGRMREIRDIAEGRWQPPR
jgi:hypothetical protein